MRAPFATILVLPLLALIQPTQSFAQAFGDINKSIVAPPALDKLYPGYEPTILNSTDEVQKIFDEMPTGFRGKRMYGLLGGGSQCYHRAQIWSYNFYRNMNLKPMKVFVFYTHAFKKVYQDMHNKKFDWWFHVAPYFLVRNSQTNQLEEFVVDPTFAETPLAMKPWTDLFVETKRQCKEFVSFEDFKYEVIGSDKEHRAIVGREHCYIVRAPAVDFSPEEVEARAQGRITDYHWNLKQIDEALKSAPTMNNKDDYRSMLGFPRN